MNTRVEIISAMLQGGSKSADLIEKNGDVTRVSCQRGQRLRVRAKPSKFSKLELVETRDNGADEREKKRELGR